MHRAAVLEVVVQAFLFTEALDEMQVRLVVLHAVFAFGAGLAELEVIAVGKDAVVLQDSGNDLRHGLLLEDALIDAVVQVRQVRPQGHGVVGQPLARISLGDAVDQAMHANAVRAELQKGRAIDQGVQVQCRIFADQLQLKGKGLADGFCAGKGQYLKVVFDVLQVQAEMRLMGGCGHHVLLHL